MAEHMTPEEIREIVRDTVFETLTGLGFDPDDPLAAQRDMQFIRDWRKASEAVKGKALVTIISVLVVGSAGALLLGLKAILMRP